MSKSQTVTVTYSLTSTYTKQIDLSQLPSDAPTDLDDLADWLDENARHDPANLTETDNWVDADPCSIEILDVEAAS